MAATASATGGEVRLVDRCIDAAARDAVTVEAWRRQRRSLERLPAPLADALFRRLASRRVLFPSLLEVFKWSVEEVDLSGSLAVDAEWLSYLGSFRYLRVLKLADCKNVDNGAIWSLAGMDTLKELDLSRCTKISDAGLRHIVTIQSLEKLHLSGTRLTDNGVKLISSLTNLRFLDLGGIRITDKTLRSLQVLTRLEHLDVWGSEITNEGASVLKAFTRLSFLNLYWTSVNHLPVPPTMRYLNMSKCKIHSICYEDSEVPVALENLIVSEAEFGNIDQVFSGIQADSLLYLPEYGPKLKEDYVTVRHLPKIETGSKGRCCSSCCFNFCSSNWQKVWAVLKPGFLALLQDPFDPKLLDIVIFDVSPCTDRNGEGQTTLANEIKERNPLHFGFEVSSGGRSIKLRTRSSAKVKDWVTAINAARRPPEGWCHPHRFGSFAPPRGLTEDGSMVQWFIDGRAAFDAIASSIEEAKSEIFITDWWLCPELYLRRPFHFHGSSRLDILLESRAKQGVQIYILLYKEVSLALKINSMYSKRRLLNIHENVKVLRYPDHFSTGIYLWSHHEKIVVVDNQVCYIGGLDLCFGRYDSPEHKVADFPPSTWPGKDYYNPREYEPNSWEDTMKDELDRTKYPRMPWHDVQCALYGPACRDVARHFVQRWNYAKRNKAPNEQAIPLLMPHHHMVIPHYMGTSKETDGETESKQNHNMDIKFNRLNSLTAPASCQDIPLLLPHEPDHHAFPNGEFGLNGMDISNGLSDHTNKTNRNQPLPNRKAKLDLSSQDLQMKGFVDNVGSPEVSVSKHCDTSKPDMQNIDKEWWEAQERGDQVASVLDVGEVGPRAACRCQVVRSVGPWSAGTTQIEGSIHNAYFSLIEKAEHFVYIENQFFISGLSGDDTIKNRVLEALYRRILRAEKEKKRFRVIIVIPLLPGFQGGIDDGGAASVRAIMHWQYRTICRGPNSILKNLYDVVGSKAHYYISFYGLRAHGRLGDGGPLVTNQIYVHSKLMIIDDRMALIGSANINDRSLLGSRDSEIGMIIEDKEVVSSIMDGKPWEAGKFSLSLRLSLWAEHLGLLLGEVSCIMDPVDDSVYKNIWMATAKVNTMIYQQVFSCVPNDHIHSRYQFRQSFAHRKEKIGHTTIDLGVALEKQETKQDRDLADADPMEQLQAVRGHIVSFPLEFMCQEDLRPFFSESEYYTSPQVFH